MKSTKASAVFLTIFSLMLSTSCSSAEGNVKKACSLTFRGTDALKAKDPAYTDYFNQAADILQRLAEKDEKYREIGRAHV